MVGVGLDRKVVESSMCWSLWMLGQAASTDLLFGANFRLDYKADAQSLSQRPKAEAGGVSEVWQSFGYG